MHVQRVVAVRVGWHVVVVAVVVRVVVRVNVVRRHVDGRRGLWRRGRRHVGGRRWLWRPFGWLRAFWASCDG